jgi:hypothetical protein
MAQLLQRYAKPLDFDHLQAVLEGASWASESLSSRIPAESVREAIASVPSTLTGTDIDRELVEPLHRSLAHLSRREGADMRVWHLLCVQSRQLIWRRWLGEVPSPGEMGSSMTVTLSGRFLGKSTLNGISRNTLARLWWTAEHLRDGDDYELARLALSNQDTFQAIFERFFGIYPPAARACLDRLPPHGERERRMAARWLQQCLSTTVLEALSLDQIGEILDEALPRVRA